MLLNEILVLKFPSANFLKEIILQDEGKGPYIKEWNLESPQPSQEDLDKWAIDYDLQYRQQQAVAQRVYPAISAQLDMIYHDHVNNTNVWIDTIEAIKLAHPKPME